MRLLNSNDFYKYLRLLTISGVVIFMSLSLKTYGVEREDSHEELIEEKIKLDKQKLKAFAKELYMEAGE